MTFGSLFSGIGGIDLGLQRAGMECRWQVEVDEYCRRVLEKHWPKVPRYGDIRELSGEELEHVDLIAGGFPCQDVSTAGHRLGLAGERSGLWSEFARLIRVVGPRWALVENVSALLHRGMGTVLGDLAACGYDAEWDCIPAAAVGAPHIRDRVFILAYPRRESGQIRQGGIFGCVDVVQQGDDGAPQERCPHRKLVALVAGVHPRTPADWWRAQSRMARSAHGVPDRVERLEALGNAVVPQCAQWIGERIMTADRHARDAATRAAAREEIAALGPEAVARRVSELSRR